MQGFGADQSMSSAPQLPDDTISVRNLLLGIVTTLSSSVTSRTERSPMEAISPYEPPNETGRPPGKAGRR